MDLVNSLQFHQQMLYQQQIALHHLQREDLSSASGWSMMSSPMSAGPRLTEDVKVELENKKLWQQFHAENTEMIITKSGRRMFPAIQLTLKNLEPRTRYCVLLELDLASDRRHKYVGGVTESNSSNRTSTSSPSTGPRGWTSAGPAEPQPSIERRLYLHPDSPASGSHWMQHPLSFTKLKLTNNVVEHHSNVLLTSMHKYVPRIWIVRCDEISNVRDLYKNPSTSFEFKETEFIAVTAYQNENITKLKIDHNPFAKGFRESGQSACKRKRLRPEGCTSSSSTSEISSHDEEEGQFSSSESDHDSPAAKRPRRHDEERTTPPVPEVAQPAEPRRDEAQPRLHRPWTDNESEQRTATTTTSRITTTPTRCLQRPAYENPQMTLRIPQYADYLGVHYHTLMAMELAKMRERYVAPPTQHLPVMMDYRRLI